MKELEDLSEILKKQAEQFNELMNSAKSKVSELKVGLSKDDLEKVNAMEKLANDGKYDELQKLLLNLK